MDFKVEHKKYANDRVQSAMVTFPDGSKKSLGFMTVGSYEFTTDTAERIEILEGSVDVTIGYGKKELLGSRIVFNIPANTTFYFNVLEDMQYLCTYK